MAITTIRRLNWPLAGLLLLTLVVRGSVLWAMRHNLDQDPDAYREIAENLLNHGEFALRWPGGYARDRATAYRPPLYPLVLSNLAGSDRQSVSLFKVATLHVLLGVATVWLTWLTAKRFVRWAVPTTVGTDGPAGPDPRGNGALGAWRPAPALLAGLLVACDPILLNQQTLVMTETLAAFLAILSLWCLSKFNDQPSWFNAALAGGAIGLAVLCRPTFLPWLGLIVLSIALLRSQTAVRLGWRATSALVLGLAAAAMLSPWAIRNYHIFGKPILTTTHGGYTLYLGNNRSFYKHLTESKSELPWQASEMETVNFSRDQPLTERHVEIMVLLQEEAKAFAKGKQRWHPELWNDRVAYALAQSAIRENPRAFVRASLYRIGQLWSPLPHKLTTDESLGRRLLRYATCVWYLAVYALAAVGVWKLRWNLLRPPWLYGVLLCLAFTAVHTFYWTNLRMRAPLMPFVAIVAAAAMVRYENDR